MSLTSRKSLLGILILMSCFSIVGFTALIPPPTGTTKKILDSMSMTPKLEAAETYSIPASIVNLPQGQHFMYIIPSEQATTISLAKYGRNIYVTYEMTNSCDIGLICPRVIRFLQAGDMPHSWQEVLRIHEH